MAPGAEEGAEGAGTGAAGAVGAGGDEAGKDDGEPTDLISVPPVSDHRACIGFEAVGAVGAGAPISDMIL